MSETVVEVEVLATTPFTVGGRGVNSGYFIFRVGKCFHQTPIRPLSAEIQWRERIFLYVSIHLSQNQKKNK